MPNMKKDTIEAKGLSIQVYTEDFKNDYISLTDIAKEWREEKSKIKSKYIKEVVYEKIYN